MIIRDKLTFKGSYAFAASNAINDPVLMQAAAEFDKQVMHKIEAMTPADLSVRYAGSDRVLVTTKYDGESCFVYFEQGKEAFCFSASSGRVRLGFAAVTELAEKLNAAGVKKCLLRAELYLDGSNNIDRRAGVSDVIRISFSGDADEVAQLKLALIDAVMLDGKNLIHQQSDFQQTVDLLTKLVGNDETHRAHTMKAVECPESEVAKVFEEIVAAGGEGIVVRRFGRIEARKVKPQRTIDAAIIGYVEDENEGKLGVASLLTALTYAEESTDLYLQCFMRVGSGLSDADRVAMLDRLKPMKLDAPLAMTDSSGRSINFIKPGLIAELVGEDLIREENGRELRSQMFKYSATSGQYEFLGLTRFVRLGFARYLKLREDKQLAAGGARIEQIAIDGKRPEPSVPKPTETKVIRREVYAKGEMVRKLLVVEKTGDEQAYHYLIYWTDFSAKRAKPLDVSLQLANSAERAQALAEALLAEGLTKGFARVG